MILVLIGFFVIAMTLCIIFGIKNEWNSCGWAIGVGFSVIFLIICCIVCVGLFTDIQNDRLIPEKIVMYEEENDKIESQISAAINAYIKHENEVYSNFKTNDENAITIVAAIPELNSSTLVQSQIETYTNNNAKIKELKEDLIGLKVEQWWLYFGGE